MTARTSTPAGLRPLELAARRLQEHPATLAGSVFLVLLTLAARGIDANGAAWACFQLVLIAVAKIDLATRRIPNGLLAAAAVAILLLRALFVHGALLETVAAGAACYVGFLIVAVAARGALGMGDVKLAGLLGLALGATVLPALLLGTIAGAVAALVLARRAGTTKTRLAYGPYLCLGAAVAVLLLSPPALA
ncbi:MAG TPA: prepilin peptidase [Gaiellaceae bacterium]|nr:prepilin peptidase [Gaiellaceae bacterium]